MRRKVVKQGAATLMVSLPSKWAKKFGLKKGDEVDIEEVENHLLISKEAIDKKKKTEINLTTHAESSIRTAVINTYRAGYDIIKIDFKSEKQYQVIVNTLKDYIIGFDLIKKEKNSCIVENITEPSEDQFEILFRKILYNISLLINNTEERLKNKIKFEDYKEVVFKIHQYDNFCRRVITKKNLLATESSLFWSFLTLLTHGQRELYHLNNFLDKNKVSFKNFEFYNNLKKIFDLLREGYIKKDMTRLEKIHELEKTIIYKEFYKAVQKNQKENIVLYHIAVSIRNFYLASSPLMGLLLRQVEP